MRHQLTSPTGASVSYEVGGAGPALVLVHGGFSDEISNWEYVQPMMRRHFTTYAVARRGRGGGPLTKGHSLEHEAMDVAAVIRAISEPVFLLGHSYGALCALEATTWVPGRVRKLVLYEPPAPDVLPAQLMTRLEQLAAIGAWEEFAITFFRDGLQVPIAALDTMRSSPEWKPILSDARATLGDLRALTAYDFRLSRFHGLAIPTLFQVGTESPSHLYATDSLVGALADALVEPLEGQAHEGMTTAPELYAESVIRFLLGKDTATEKQPVHAS